jgi:hypothetical protein
MITIFLIFFNILFFDVLLGAGGPAELREVACDEEKEKEKEINIYLFIYFIYLLKKFSFGLNPADIPRVKPWEPPHLLPLNSYLLPLLLYKTPHESYFSFFLCSHLW